MLCTRARSAVTGWAMKDRSFGSDNGATLMKFISPVITPGFRQLPDIMTGQPDSRSRLGTRDSHAQFQLTESLRHQEHFIRPCVTAGIMPARVVHGQDDTPPFLISMRMRDMAPAFSTGPYEYLESSKLTEAVFRCALASVTFCRIQMPIPTAGVCVHPTLHPAN